MKYEKYFRVEEVKELGVTIITHYYKNTDLRYAYSPKIINNTKIALKFENGTYYEGFYSKKERDEFLKIYLLKLKEANTYGKN